jgi:hypothetical protein
MSSVVAGGGSGFVAGVVWTIAVATGRGWSRSVATVSSGLSSSICAICRATDCGLTRYLSPSVVAIFCALR